MPNYHSIEEADLDGKKVLLRAGFDVPLEGGKVTDTSRIDALVPTMSYILEHGAALIIMAHQDRPKGKVVPEFSQKPLVAILEKELGCTVEFASSCRGLVTKKMVDALAPGQVLLLENLRYETGEEANDEEFAKELAAYADIYVNDAFSNAHRNHASMTSVAKLLPSYMGLQLAQEVKNLSLVVDSPRRPLTLIISGAKMETKVPVIEFFMNRGDHILLGGAIANTFIAASGIDVGSSLYEASFADAAKTMLKKSGKDGNALIHLPTDAIVAAGPDGEPTTLDLHRGNIGNSAIFDIGPKTAEKYAHLIKDSQTVVWNGPLGMYENAHFAGASKAIAEAMHKAAGHKVTTIIGGGDTIDLHTKYTLDMSVYTFVSTGGGAMLDFVSGKELPALQVLAA